jgi:hypothetical protein
MCFSPSEKRFFKFIQKELIMKNINEALKSTIQLAKQEKLSVEDITFISGFGWITALSISIAAAAAGS